VSAYVAVLVFTPEPVSFKIRESGIALEVFPKSREAPRRALGRAQLSRKSVLSVGFAADVGRCDVKGILAGRISWARPS
jgi:hypothetical protein